MNKTLINLGSGSRSAFRYMESQQPPDGWQEIRVDLDPNSNPDVVASLTDLGGHIADNSADVVFCSHAIEHIADHLIATVFSETIRILKPTGFAVFLCPDLAQLIREFDPEDLEKTIYSSPAGPISALDIIYGHRASVSAGQEHMLHRTGFTEKSLADRLMEAGFHEVFIQQGRSCDMIAVAALEACSDMGLVEGLVPGSEFEFGFSEAVGG